MWHCGEMEIIYTPSPPRSLCVTRPFLHRPSASTGSVISHYARSHLGNWAMQSRWICARGGGGGTVACILPVSWSPLATSSALHLLHLYLDSVNGYFSTTSLKASKGSSGTLSQFVDDKQNNWCRYREPQSYALRCHVANFQKHF